MLTIGESTTLQVTNLSKKKQRTNGFPIHATNINKHWTKTPVVAIFTFAAVLTDLYSVHNTNICLQTFTYNFVFDFIEINSVKLRLNAEIKILLENEQRNVEM